MILDPKADMLKISTMSGKLKGFLSINFDSLTNPFCSGMASTNHDSHICTHCYSRYMIRTFRKRAQAGWIRNMRIMEKPLYDWQIPRFRPDTSVRFLSHGDIYHSQQWQNFKLIARENPRTEFAIWSKNSVVLNVDDKPPNLRIIFSSHWINEPAFGTPPPGIDAIFTVYRREEDIPSGSFICNGRKCLSCMYCYTAPKGHIAEVLR